MFRANTIAFLNSHDVAIPTLRSSTTAYDLKRTLILANDETSDGREPLFSAGRVAEVFVGLSKSRFVSLQRELKGGVYLTFGLPSGG